MMPPFDVFELDSTPNETFRFNRPKQILSPQL